MTFARSASWDSPPTRWDAAEPARPEDPGPDRTSAMARGEVGTVVPASWPWAPEGVLQGCRPVLRSILGGSGGPIGVTSASRREGRSTIAAGLARVLRDEHQQSTVLIELDAGARSSASAFPGHDGPGLLDVLDGAVSTSECVRWLGPGLGVLTAGPVDDVPEVLSRFRHSQVLRDLKAAGHAVVADLPPLPPHGGADRVVDAFPDLVLVVRTGVTPRAALQSALVTLGRTPVVVLNQKASSVPRWLRRPLGV